MGLLRVHSDQRPASEHVPCMRDGRAATAVYRSAGRIQAGLFVRSPFRASQELSRPLRRLLQVPGAVLLRLGGRRGDLWLRAHGLAVLSACVPPHGLVPAAGVRSEGGRRALGLPGAVHRHFLFQSLFLLQPGYFRWGPFLGPTLVQPQKESNPQFRTARPGPRPRAPRVLPPLSAPLPLMPAPPGLLRSGSVAGTGDAMVFGSVAGTGDAMVFGSYRPRLKRCLRCSANARRRIDTGDGCSTFGAYPIGSMMDTLSMMDTVPRCAGLRGHWLSEHVLCMRDGRSATADGRSATAVQKRSQPAPSDCASDCTCDCASDCTCDCASDSTYDCPSDCTCECASDCTCDCPSDCTCDCN